MPDLTTPTIDDSQTLQTPFQKSLTTFGSAPEQVSEPLYNVEFANNPERASLRTALPDKAGNGGLTPAAMQQGQEFRDMSMNFKALSVLTGKPIDLLATQYEQEKQAFSLANGYDQPENDGQFRSQLTDHFNKLDMRTTALDEARQQALQDAQDDTARGQPVSTIARYAQWEKANALAFTGVPVAQRMDAFMQAYQPTKIATRSTYSKLAQEIVSTFQNEQASKDLESRDKAAQGQAQNLANTALNTLGVRGAVFGDGETVTAKDAGMPESHPQIIDKIDQVPPEDLPKLKALVQLYARSNEVKNGDNTSHKYAFYKVAQSLERTAENMAIGTAGMLSLPALNYQLEQATDPSAQATIKKQISMVRSASYLRSMVHEDVNPIQNTHDAAGFAEGIAQGIAGAVPYMAAFGMGAVTGSVLMVTSTMADVRARLIANNPQVSEKSLNIASSVIGLPVALLQLLGMGTIAEAFPAVEGLFKTLPLDHPMLNSLLHGGVSTAALTLSSELEIIGNKVAHAFDADFQSVELGKEMFDTFLHAGSTFAVMMALGGMGHGKLDATERKALISMLKDPVSLKLAGIKPAQCAPHGITDDDHFER